MADLVNLGDRLKAKQAEQTEYFERMDLTAKMIPVMVEAIDKMRAIGADRAGPHRTRSRCWFRFANL